MPGPTHLLRNGNGLGSEISRQIQSALAVDLFLDYDGTLTPIRKDPDAATLSRPMQNLLEQFAQLQADSIAIVTGRSMDDIRKMIRLKRIALAANHGFQISRGKTTWLHPAAAAAIPKLAKLSKILRTFLAAFPSAFVENKLSTLSIHYRNVPSTQVASLESLVKRTVSSFDRTLVLTCGKKVLEVRPHADWGKGRAVSKMLQSKSNGRNSLPVYVGDDVTDEDVFRDLASNGITVRVGKSTSTAARYYLDNITEVGRFLRILLELRLDRAHHQRC